MHFSENVENQELSNCFKEFAKEEGLQAQKLQEYIEKFK